MNLKRTNYGTARTVLSIFELIAWAFLCIGIIATLTLVGTATRSFGGSGLVALLPGLIFCIVAILIIVIIQASRAGVDSADYAYQSLAIARQQLEISKQALKQDTRAQSFADRPPVTAATENAARAEAPGTASYATAPAARERKDTALDWDYRDTRIHRTQEGYLVEGQVFETLELAKNFVDGEALRASLASPT